VFLTGNTVRASYGGFWLVSSADLQAMYAGVLGPLGYPTAAALPVPGSIYAPLIDRIFVLVNAIGRSMNYQSPVSPAPDPSALAGLGSVLGAQRVQTTSMELVQHALQPEQAQPAPAAEAAEHAAVAPAENPDPLTPAPVPVKMALAVSPTSPITIPITSASPTGPKSSVLGNLNPVLLQAGPPVILHLPTPVLPGLQPTPTDYNVPVGADVGTSLVLRASISGNQIDAVIANSYSGAGLILVDLAATPGSALVSDNRIRSRIPMGAAAWLTNLVECVVTGNTIRNEAMPVATAVSPGAPLASPYSILAISGTPTDPVSSATTGLVVSGNVLVGGMMQPLTRVPAVAAPLNDWGVFNTIVTFNPQLPAATPPPPAPAAPPPAATPPSPAAAPPS
jgi:hypothetical protein